MPTVPSFGKVIANSAINVIPDEVYIEGTLRTMNEDWRNEAHQRMKTIAEGIPMSMVSSCTFKINRGYPFLVNNAAVTDYDATCAVAYLGSNNVTEAEI